MVRRKAFSNDSSTQGTFSVSFSCVSSLDSLLVGSLKRVSRGFVVTVFLVVFVLENVRPRWNKNDEEGRVII